MSGASAPLALPLHVEAYDTPGVYADPQIVYRDDAMRYATYPNREWAIPLGTMLATLTAETLRHALGPGARVHDGDAPASRALVWRGTVREFEEVERGGQVFASVRLEAQLVRTDDDSTVWLGSARAEALVGRTTDMAVVADSLSSAASRVVATLARDAMSAAQGSETAQTSARPIAPR
jgi:uncharacterized lipoprotein YmbA